MPKRVALYSLLLIAAFAMAVGILVLINNSTKTLSYQETLTQDLAQEGCSLTGWKIDKDGRRHSFSFLNRTDASDISLIVANVFSFDVFCNGALIYSYDSTLPSARLKQIAIPLADSGQTTLAFEFDQPQSSVRAQLGLTGVMASQIQLGKLLYTFCLGILVLILLYCISLLIQKPNEIILAYMVVLILLVIARDITQPFGFMPQIIPTYLKSGMNLLLVGGMALLSAEYVFADFFKTHRNYSALFIGILLVLTALCYVIRGKMFVPFYLCINGLLHIACGICIVVGCARRVPCSGYLLAGLAFAFGAFTFYTAVDQGLLQAGAIAVQGYIIQLYNIPFLLACMIAINSRFVGYYHKLKRLNEHLDALVEQRAEELRIQEEQKHQLMINVFHDLRTPLFVALGCAERLEANPKDAETLTVLKDRLGFMQHMTDDLFTIAKLESGDLMMVEDIVSLSDATGREAASLNVLAQESGVLLEQSIEPNCNVWGDEKRIEQVAQNLISNAVRHTPQGGTVTIHVYSDAQARQVCLAVANDGDAINPQEANRIFERYYQTQEGGSNGSSGLGLSISKEIMRAHHGDITLQRTPDNKNLFTAVFPMLPEE